MEVDNFGLIRPLLDFRSEDDFYFIQVLQRKKDYEKGKIKGPNNNSRLIRPYYVGSMDYFNFIEEEVKTLCRVFGARAGINLNRRSYSKMALQHLRKVCDQILDQTFNKAHKAYASVVGAYNHEFDKRWIIDIDEVGRSTDVLISFIERECEPFGPKFIKEIPSKNGIHLITRPFNAVKFAGMYPELEIHKNNPTNLFIP